MTCDRIYGFFEARGGVANGPILKGLVRELVGELKLALVSSSRGGTPTRRSREDGLPRSARNDDADVSAIEARGYYDQLAAMGILELAESIGVKNVFCTVWGMVNEMVSRSE